MDHMANGDKLLIRHQGAKIFNDANTSPVIEGSYLKQVTEVGTVGGVKVIAETVSLVGSDGSTTPNIVSSGRTVQVATTIIRPADTTPYSISDVVSNSTSAPTILTFTDLARITNGSGYITNARILINNVLNVGVSFRLHLYRSPVSMINDNAPFTLLYTNSASRLGSIDFSSTVTEGTGSDSVRASNTDIRLAYANTTNANIFGILETLTAFTPTSGQQFTVTLTAEQN